MDLCTVCLGLSSLFDDPNPDDPLNVEAAKVMTKDMRQFKRNIKQTLQGYELDGIKYEKFIWFRRGDFYVMTRYLRWDLDLYVVVGVFVID